MKKLFTSVLFLFLLVLPTFSVELLEEKTYEYDISDCTKSIKIANLWLVENLDTNNNEVKLYDEGLETMVVDGFILESMMITLVPSNYTMKVHIKGDKLIIKFNNFSGGTAKVPFNKRTAKSAEKLYAFCDKSALSLYNYYKEY